MFDVAPLMIRCLGGYNCININVAFGFDCMLDVVPIMLFIRFGGGAKFININVAFVFDCMFDVVPRFNLVVLFCGGELY